MTIPAGQTSATFSIPILANTSIEPNKTFTVNLTSTDPNLAEASVTGDIDNTNFPSVSITPVSTTVEPAASGTTPYVFDVTLTATPQQTVTFNYATAPGTAVPGTDYTSTNGTITFAAGTTTLTQQITVNVMNNPSATSNPTFFVNLTQDGSTPTNVNFTNTQAEGVIVDQTTLTPSPATALNTAASITFSVSLAAANPTQAVTVQYSTANGTGLTGSP